MSNNSSNTNARTNENNLNANPGVANKQDKPFSIRMVLDPEFVTKYCELSDDIIKR